MSQTQLTPEQAIKLRAHYRYHPEWFTKNILGIEWYAQQIEIGQSVVHNRTTSVASCNSAGKTNTAGCLVPWYLSSWPESLVVTTAPTWRQVKDLLWSEVNTRYGKSKIPLGGNINMTSWQISPNWFAVGVSSKDPNRVQGYHADSGHILVIADEAAAIEELMFEGFYAILTSAEARFVMLGNPTSQSGTFRDSHKPGSLANRIKIDGFDTPNFIANGIRTEEDLERIAKVNPKFEGLKMPYPNLISPVWAYERLKKWGKNSPMYQARVRANFPDSGENNLIPLSWIEKACTNERLERILGLNLKDPTPDMSNEAAEKLEADNDRVRKEALDNYISSQNTVRGVDVARFGSDSTVITPRWGHILGRQRSYHKESTMQTAGRVWAELINLPTDLTGVDVIGLGAGVVDRLHELQEEQTALGNDQFSQVIGVNVALPASEVPKELGNMEFANKRAELYWTLRQWFEDGEIYLMPDDDGKPPEDLMAELSSIEYKFLGGKIYIEEKKDMKKRLAGKSPDRADSAMLTLIRSENTDYYVDDSPAPTPKDEDDEEPDEQYQDDEELVGFSPDAVY